MVDEGMASVFSPREGDGDGDGLRDSLAQRKEQIFTSPDIAINQLIRSSKLGISHDEESMREWFSGQQQRERKNTEVLNIDVRMGSELVINGRPKSRKK